MHGRLVITKRQIITNITELRLKVLIFWDAGTRLLKRLMQLKTVFA